VENCKKYTDFFLQKFLLCFPVFPKMLIYPPNPKRNMPEYSPLREWLYFQNVKYKLSFRLSSLTSVPFLITDLPVPSCLVLMLVYSRMPSLVSYSPAKGPHTYNYPVIEVQHDIVTWKRSNLMYISFVLRQ